jgi:hypothetical protein
MILEARRIGYRPSDGGVGCMWEGWHRSAISLIRRRAYPVRLLGG